MGLAKERRECKVCNELFPIENKNLKTGVVAHKCKDILFKKTGLNNVMSIKQKTMNVSNMIRAQNEKNTILFAKEIQIEDTKNKQVKREKIFEIQKTIRKMNDIIDEAMKKDINTNKELSYFDIDFKSQLEDLDNEISEFDNYLSRETILCPASPKKQLEEKEEKYLPIIPKDTDIITTDFKPVPKRKNLFWSALLEGKINYFKI